MQDPCQVFCLTVWLMGEGVPLEIFYKFLSNRNRKQGRWYWSLVLVVNKVVGTGTAC